MKSIFKYLLYLFPLIYLILGFYFRQIFGDLSLRSTDPEYIHFLSGMCVSTGQFGQANIDHPGSILQLILAGVFRLVYFFRGTNYPFFEDAIIHSDLYLSVGNLVITGTLSGTLLWAGKETLKISKSYLYAFLVQVSPFLINMWYDIFGRIYPELLILVPILIIQVQLLRALFKKNSNQLIEVFIYAFAIAMGLSLKMTFLPVVFIPLLVLKSTKRKLQFIGASILVFLLISLPVTFQLETFWNWMKGIFMHSGAYQGGANTIIDIDLFFNNLKTIFIAEKYFFVILLFLIVGLLFILFKRSSKFKILTLINLGLLFTITGCLFIIGKQYAFRYFIPALLFFPFILVLNLELAKQLFSKKIIVVLSLLIAVFIFFEIRDQIPYIRAVSENVESQMEARIHTREFINSITKDSYKIIASQDYGCPYQEYAIMYSFCVAGKEWPDYLKKLDKIYPNTYLFFTWDNTLKYWGSEFNPSKIIKSGKPVYLYLENNSEELYNRTLDKINPDHSFNITSELLFLNRQNSDVVFELFFQTNNLPASDIK